MRNHIYWSLMAVIVSCLIVLWQPLSAQGAEDSPIVPAEEIEKQLTRRSIGTVPISAPSSKEEPSASPAQPELPQATGKPSKPATMPSMAGVVSLDTIQFDLNSANLRPEAIRQLDEVAIALESSILRTNPIQIEGHTCNMGSFEHNQELSEHRATAVKAYLVARGISSDRLTTRGWGLSRPITKNGSDAERARNRRVDFVNVGVMPEATPELMAEAKPLLRGRGLAGTVPPESTASPFSFLATLIHNSIIAVNPVNLTVPITQLEGVGQFAIETSGNQGHYLYILIQSITGAQTWLTPLEQGRFGRWCYAAQTVRYPEKGFLDVLPEDMPVTLFVLSAKGNNSVVPVDIPAFLSAAHAFRPGTNAVPPSVDMIASAPQEAVLQLVVLKQ